VDHYEGLLIHYAARLLGGDVDRARDVVQDTFLKLWTADRAGIDGHLGQWLYRVCRNGALDVRRKEARMTTLQETHAEVEADDARGAAREQERAAGQVFQMLESLPERQQEVIRLKFQGGLSYREIANVMDLTVTHVGVLIHNGLKAIREKLHIDPAGSAPPESFKFPVPEAGVVPGALPGAG
jgi:RNA polymerase sigma-70 factor (ECF subfamily)